MVNRENFFKALRINLHKHANEGNDSAYNILKDVVIFAKEAPYSSTPLPYLADLLRGQSMRNISSLTHTSYTTIKDRVYRHSNVLYDLLGSDFFSLLDTVDGVATASTRLETAKNMANFSIRESVDAFIIAEYKMGTAETDIDISGYKEEYNFLLRHNRQRLIEEYNKLDKQRLFNLIAYLDSKEFDEKKATLIKGLLG